MFICGDLHEQCRSGLIAVFPRSHRIAHPKVYIYVHASINRASNGAGLSDVASARGLGCCSKLYLRRRAFSAVERFCVRYTTVHVQCL